MKFASFAYSMLGLVTAGSLAWGCSSKSSDCNANLNCGPYTGGAAGTSGTAGSSGKAGGSGKSGNGGDAGVGNEGGSAGDEGGASGVSGTSGTAGTGGAPCMGTSAPDTAQCVIGDDYGVFVSLSGDDTTGDGTETKPLATVTKALSLTGPGKINRVYVCSTANGGITSYAEPDTLLIPDRVSIYGGFTCVGGAWAYDNTVKAWLKPSSAVGAIVSGALNGVTVQDVRIDATNAADDGTGASSFGMIVKGSKGVVLTRVEVHAGKGGGGLAGANGATGPDGTPSGAAQNGAAAVCSSPPNSQDGAKALAPICTSQGGNGGTAAVGTVKVSGQDGQSGFPNYSTNNGVGQGAGQNGLPGQPGANGSPGTLGSAATTQGAFSATGYTRAGGGDGTSGKPGQGGGGGGASLGSAACVGASGAAGGMGGCGGDLGSGGIGGGASVGLLDWDSALTLDACALFANTGGGGGTGGVAHVGGAGKAGGAGGLGEGSNTIGGGGDGGKGGNGGNGGSGAGGTGGPSIALVYSVTKPIALNAPTLMPGAGGAHGAGGHLGLNTANWAPDGSDGTSLAQYEQK